MFSYVPDYVAHDGLELLMQEPHLLSSEYHHTWVIGF